MMLSHDFYYPDISPRCNHPGVSKRRDRWGRQAIVLWLLSQGFSLRVEVQHLMASLFATNPRSGALMRVMTGLNNNGLLHAQTVELQIFRGRYTKFTLVRLSEQGKELVQTLGWMPQESE